MSIPPINDSLEQLFDEGHSLLDRLAERWHRGGNRRTMAIIVLGGAVVAYIYLSFVRPPERFPIGELVSVPAGQSLTQVSALLEEGSVVRSAAALRALLVVMGDERSVHAGDYLFKEPRDLFSVARALALGAYGLEPLRVRVPEGATVKEIARICMVNLPRFNADNFIVQAAPHEGYLFPDTYFFLPNATEATVYEAMRQNFDARVEPIRSQIASSTHSLDEIVTMASILEREAFNTYDRRMIAGVLYNRLARGMALQVDATFVYTLGKGTFQLTMADLKSDSPYNTYVRKGLPPTPIGSPSMDSILAALNPTKNEYLFFLADHGGVTHYCKTYSCQLANKAKYF